MMRLGVVTTSYPRFAGDPAGSFVAAHVAATRALGHELDVIAAGDRAVNGETRVASRLFYGAGGPEELERGGASLAAASFTARLALAVARRTRSWDAAFAHWLAPSALAALPARRLLAIAHGGDIHALRRAHLLGPVLYALRARNARLAFVAGDLLDLSRAAAPPLSRWLDTAAIVQPMGIDLARFAAIQRAPTRTILVVARLVPIKGVDVAIRAARELDADLVIAGDGPERAALERLVADGARPESRVRFVGAVDPDQRDRLLATAACVVVPSRVLPSGRTEGTPMIALEALAAGVPVVASEVGGLRALAPAARLVSPDDPTALAAAIDPIFAAPPRSTELHAAVAHLDWPHVANRLLAHLT
jgi:glycosyltransferase involved in cell wall biosynthesis